MREFRSLVMAAVGLVLVFIPVLSACQGSVSEPKVQEVHMTVEDWEFLPNEIVVEKGTLIKFHITAWHGGDHNGYHQEADNHQGHEHEKDIDHTPEGYVHSLTIPGYVFELKLKEGENYGELYVDKIGEFSFNCSVWCGISEDGTEGHHTMLGKLVVVEHLEDDEGEDHQH